MRFRSPHPDWLTGSARAIERCVPELGRHSDALAERLAALLIQRLPEHWSRQLLNLLPNAPAALGRRVLPSGDAGVGYSDFLETALDGLAFVPSLEFASSEHAEEAAMRTAETFLATVATHLPVRMARDLGHVLPSDLASRMGLPGVADRDRPLRPAA